MRSDATSEARVRGEAPQALPVEGALSPNNCTRVRFPPPPPFVKNRITPAASGENERSECERGGSGSFAAGGGA